jgi:predicted anti-sigma-YlaC factor YlaD
MTCERYREAASARLDGEPLQMSAAVLDHHLATCANCASWLHAATDIGRTFRISRHTPPDLSDQIMRQVVLPTARVQRYRRRLRIGLGALGFVQWALAMPELFGDSVGMSMSMHGSHETAAWNLALGAAFLAVAVRPIRAVGALPILATFVAALGVLSIGDIAAGTVPAARLASHAGIVLGTILIALMARSERLLPRGGLHWAMPVSNADPAQEGPGTRGSSGSRGVA